MKTKEIVLLIAGLVLGLAVGFGIATSNANSAATVASQNLAAAQAEVAQLQTVATAAAAATPVMRTVNEAASTSDFYLVSLDQVQSWLTDDLKVEMTDDMVTDVATIPTELSDETALKAALADTTSTTHQYLATIYAALAAKLPADSDAPISTCFALESDLFAGANNLYFYVQVPVGEAQKPLEIPKDWTLLDGPLPQSEIWSSDCYEAADAALAAEATPEPTASS